jgi:hypothetical protein
VDQSGPAPLAVADDNNNNPDLIND